MTARKVCDRHGHAIAGDRSRTYECWRSMKKRCSSRPTRSAGLMRIRKRYIDIGITVCERWETSFAAFLEDMGEAPHGLTLDRVDNNKGYCKENCRWATRLEQSWNSSRAKLITFNGKTKSIRAWASDIGISQSALSRRLSVGWPIPKALSSKGSKS